MHSKLLALVKLTALLVVVGCRTGDGITQPQGLDRANLTSGQSCTFEHNSSIKCAELQEGINWLKNSWRADCRQLGQQAQSIFDAPAESGIGFTDGTDFPEYQMYVLAETSGRLDDHIFVNDAFWGSASASSSATGGLISHELTHYNLQDIGHTFQIADVQQTLCQYEF